MVRAIKLEQSPGGTYLNPSQGIFTSATVTASVPRVPPSPSLQAHAVSPDQIELDWTPVDNAIGYKLERQDSNGGWSQIAKALADAVSYADKGLTPGKEYAYRIRAFNDAGDSAYSDPARATTRETSLALTRSTPGAITLVIQGLPGQQLTIESSLDLKVWQMFTNSVLTSSSAEIPLSSDGKTLLFYRAVISR
jgi:hypothetical protein